MSDDTLELPSAKRPKYFTSQFLVEADFTAEQTYHLEMRRLHNRALHIWGVVDGLEVKKEGPQSVSVTPGMAIDKDGKEIIFTALSPWTGTFDKSPTDITTLFVVISHKEEGTDPYTGPGTDTKGQGLSQKFTRIVESGDLEIVANALDDGSMIKLASLTVDANGLKGDPDNTVRRMAGSSIPRGSWLGSQDLYIGADGKIGVGTPQPSEKLQVSGGNLLVKGTDNFVSSGQEGRVYLGDNNHYIKSVYGSGVRIGTATQADAITLLQDGGKVGLGTTQPGQKLEVAGALKLSTTPTVSNDQAAAYLWNQANVGPTIAGAQFEVRTGGDTPRLRIDANGKVGIGVTNPAALLQAGITPVNIGNANFFNDAIAMLTCRESNVGNIPRKPVLVFAREGQNTVSYANFARFDLGIYGGYRTQLDVGLSNESLNSEGNNTPVILSLRGNGNVGVGTTTPGFPLSFSDTPGDKISLSGQSGNHYGFGIQTSLLQIHTDTSVADIAFGYGSSGSFKEIMRIKGTGNVGIGITNPEHRLQIGNLGFDPSDASPNAGYIRFGDNTGWKLHIGREREGGGWALNTSTTGVLMTIQDNGNVGIGTPTPGQLLEVAGSYPRIRVNATSATQNQPGIQFYSSYNSAGERNWQISTSYAQMGDLAIRQSNARNGNPQDSGTTRLYIDPFGKVGIGGTNAPQHLLQIGGNFGFDPSDASPNAGYLRFGDNTGWKLHIGREREGGGWALNTSTQGVLMTIQDNGNVGIGTTNPRALLDVAQNSGGPDENAIKSVLARMSEGNEPSRGNGAGTCLAATAFTSQGQGNPSFALEHYFYGILNGWIRFCRGGSSNDGFLQLSPGAHLYGNDLAELFETAEKIVPGDVVVFDEREEMVKLCESEADSRVIGVVSSAPAGVLGKGDSNASPIALCGRVPCNVDADIAPIRAGDLLTTSPTKGHAQRVLDATRHAGAIIGKALGSLEKGKGQITVLVALA